MITIPKLSKANALKSKAETVWMMNAACAARAARRPKSDVARLAPKKRAIAYAVATLQYDMLGD